VTSNVGADANRAFAWAPARRLDHHLRSSEARAILGGGGKFFGASRGLGYMIASAASGYRADVMVVGVLVLMTLSLALTFSVQAVEARLTRWRPEAAKTF
jgi:hypothetical protein